MHNEFTAVIERDGQWCVGYCPEIPGASHQITNTGSEVLKFLCCCAPGYEQENTVLEE